MTLPAFPARVEPVVRVRRRHVHDGNACPSEPALTKTCDVARYSSAFCAVCPCPRLASADGWADAPHCQRTLHSPTDRIVQGALSRRRPRRNGNARGSWRQWQGGDRGIRGHGLLLRPALSGLPLSLWPSRQRACRLRVRTQVLRSVALRSVVLCSVVRVWGVSASVAALGYAYAHVYGYHCCCPCSAGSI